MVTRWDKFIIVTVLACALLSYIIFSFCVFGETAESVEIFVDGKLYATYDFAEITETVYLDVRTDFGYNMIEISDEGVKVADASCRDKIDVMAGVISEPGQMIICVPNRISVRIVGKNKLNVDKVTY